MKKEAYFYLEMREHELKVPYTGKNRRIRVLLPKGYKEDEHRSYPVVYMNDGQNVFIVENRIVDILGRLYQL